MFRKLPPKIKIYEALGSISDNRVEIDWLFQNEGKCYSSSRNKYYIIKYNPDHNSIITNDNGSYRQWYLWYPAIAFLMKQWIIQYKKDFSDALKWIARKDINQSFKNDFDKTTDYIHWIIISKWIDINLFLQEIDNIYNQIEKFNLKILWPKIKPPKWY
jgi:hypothetical protein